MEQRYKGLAPNPKAAAQINAVTREEEEQMYALSILRSWLHHAAGSVCLDMCVGTWKDVHEGIVKTRAMP